MITGKLKIVNLLTLIENRFKKRKIETARLDAELLISNVIGILRIDLYTDNIQIANSDIEKIEELVRRREGREPIAYILGRKEFYSIDFLIRENVFIPCPETETLITAVLDEKRYDPRVLDLCCGCGNIAITIKREIPDCEVIGVDIDDDAISLSGENCNKIISNCSGIEFRKGDLFNAVEGERFDIIVSNPPYIKTGDIEGLQDEISRYENRIALDGGEDGLLFYRKIFTEADKYLKDGGVLFVEIDGGLFSGIADILDGNYKYSVIKDLAGLKRVIKARLVCS